MKICNPFKADPDRTRKSLALETEMELIRAEHAANVIAARVGQLRLTLARLRTELGEQHGQD